MKDDGFPTWFVFLLFAICFIWGVLVGLGLKREEVEKQAIEAGVGEYYLDSNHEKQFRFKKP